MTRAAALGVISYEPESNWGENVTTFDYRLPHVGEIDVSGLTRAREPSNRLVGYLNDATQGIPGPMGGEFKLRLYLTGHGSSTAGAVTVTEVEQLLGYVFGIAASSGTGTTFTGGTASAPTTTLASGLSDGAIIFAGAIGDGGGNGQPAVISTHAGSTANLLTALPATPSNGNILYSSVMMYTEEQVANVNVQSKRFRLQTGNLQYRCHGCHPTNVAFTGLSPGERPMIEITYGVSWWTHMADAFPGTDTPNEFMPAPVAGGSCFLAARGTATRATLAVRSFTLNYALGMQPTNGHGGVVAQQAITGAVRTPSVITLDLLVDSEAATTSPTHANAWDIDGAYHLLYALNGAATGQRVAMYFPTLYYDGPRPVQVAENNLNRVRLNFRAAVGPTATNDLTLSAFRMAWG